MKPFSERNLFVIGAIGLALTAAIVVGALQYDKIPFLNQSKSYSAYFAEAGGLTTGAAVQVSGFELGNVSSIELDGPRVLVKFTVAKNIRLGDRTEARSRRRVCWARRYSRSIRAGTAVWTVPFRSSGRHRPTSCRTHWANSPTTISGLDTDQMSDSLRVLSQTFSETPPNSGSQSRAVGNSTRLNRSAAPKTSMALGTKAKRNKTNGFSDTGLHAGSLLPGLHPDMTKKW